MNEHCLIARTSPREGVDGAHSHICISCAHRRAKECKKSHLRFKVQAYERNRCASQVSVTCLPRLSSSHGRSTLFCNAGPNSRLHTRSPPTREDPTIIPRSNDPI